MTLPAVATLLAPLAAVGLSVCAPAGHCAMAGAAGQGPPCHGSAIQADDCCPAEAAAPIEVVSLASVAVQAPLDSAPTPRPEPVTLTVAVVDDAPSTPLYKLFRSLLI